MSSASCPTQQKLLYGLLDSVRLHRRQEVSERLLEANKAGTLNKELIDELIMGNWPRGEKIAHKDIKLRTFISQEEGRAKLVSHVYDILRCRQREGLFSLYRRFYHAGLH